MAQQIRVELRPDVERLTAQDARPGLGVVLVGDHPASAVYVSSKTAACDELGIHHETRRLSPRATTEDVVAVVDDYNRRGDIHGILVQLPLPPQVDAVRVLDAVDPAKDVDGFHPDNVGRLVQKRPRFVPCTPAGIMELLQRHDIEVAGKRAVVIGRSDIVGKPMALLLLHRHATVTICHSRTRDLAALARQADILVAAVGQPALVTPAFVKPGATVIDIGVNRVTDPLVIDQLLEEGHPKLAVFREKGSVLVGDVHPAVSAVAGALTPVPGGVGPLTIAMLMRNTLATARARAGASGT